MADFHVFVLSCYSGVLGVYRSRRDALRARIEYNTYGYKGLKIDEFSV